MKTQKNILVIATVLTIGFGCSAQTCGGFGDILVTSWEALYEVAHPIGQDALTLIPVVGQNEDAVQAISDASEQFHDYVFNQNSQSWSTLGPRSLHVLDERIKQYGTLVKAGVGGVRTFNTTGLFWDWVEIEIKKEDYKAETEIIVCTWDMESGAKNNFEEYTFSSGKSSIGTVKKFVIPNTYGKSISVKLKNNSFSDRFKYSISSQGFLDINKQKNRGRKAKKKAKKENIEELNSTGLGAGNKKKTRN